MTSPAASYHGHRKRIKEKYKAAGLTGWSDYEILELMLSYAVPRRDTKPIAKELTRRFSSLSGVLDAAQDDLRSVPGVAEHSALLLKLFKDVSGAYLRQDLRGKDLISSPGAALDYLRTLLKGSPDEEFHALFLDAANRPVAAERLHTGIVNRSVVYPRKIVERALSHRAVGVIIAHNHPSGVLKPSDDDIKATAAVKKALATVEISLLDHIIIGGNGYFSWLEHGLL
jgi:DNA repair protein RadC